MQPFASTIKLISTRSESDIELTEIAVPSPALTRHSFSSNNTSTTPRIHISTPLPRFLPPEEYPIRVAKATRGDSEEIVWVVIRRPLSRIGVGSRVFGMERNEEEGGMGSTALIGRVEERVGYERRYIIYRVKGEGEYYIAVPYCYSNEGIVRRIRVFLGVWKEESTLRFSRDNRLVWEKDGWKGWWDYFWGSAWRL